MRCVGNGGELPFVCCSHESENALEIVLLVAIVVELTLTPMTGCAARVIG